MERHDAAYISSRLSKEEKRRTQEVLLLRHRSKQGSKVRTERVRPLSFLACLSVFELDKSVIARASVV